MKTGTLVNAHGVSAKYVQFENGWIKKIRFGWWERAFWPSITTRLSRPYWPKGCFNIVIGRLAISRYTGKTSEPSKEPK